MDIYLFGFIILAFGSLVVTVLVMYSHSHDLRMRLELAELDLECMYENQASETNPWDLADTLEAKLKLSQQARELQRAQIKDLQEDLEELEQKLVEFGYEHLSRA